MPMPMMTRQTVIQVKTPTGPRESGAAIMRTVPMMVTTRPYVAGYTECTAARQEAVGEVSRGVETLQCLQNSAQALQTHGRPDLPSTKDITERSESDLTDDTSQVGGRLDCASLEGDLGDGAAAVVEEEDVEDRDDEIDGESVLGLSV